MAISDVAGQLFVVRCPPFLFVTVVSIQNRGVRFWANTCCWAPGIHGLVTAHCEKKDFLFLIQCYVVDFFEKRVVCLFF